MGDGSELQAQLDEIYEENKILKLRLHEETQKSIKLKQMNEHLETVSTF